MKNYHTHKVKNLQEIHQLTDEQSEQIKTFLKRALSKFKNHKEIKVLDLFCGLGYFTQLISKNLPAKTKMDSTLVDNSDDLYKLLVDNPQTEVRKVIKADLRNKKKIDEILSENKYDLIIMKMGLHEVYKPIQKYIIDRCFLSLKEPGSVIVWDNLIKRDENTNTDIFSFNKIIRYKDRLLDVKRPFYFFSLSEVRELMHDAGFETNKVTTYTRKWNTLKRLEKEIPNIETLQKLEHYILKNFKKDKISKYLFPTNPTLNSGLEFNLEAGLIVGDK